MPRIQFFSRIREAPFKFMPKAFGHCLNSFCTPRPAVNRALWDTSSPKKVPQTIRARVQTPQNQANSSQKSCPKPSGQGSRPPAPYGQCPYAFSMNLNGASLKHWCCQLKPWLMLYHFPNPTPRIQLSVRSSVRPHFWHASYIVNTCVQCYHYHTAWAPEGREGRSQAGRKGHKLEVGARRTPKLLVRNIFEQGWVGWLVGWLVGWGKGQVPGQLETTSATSTKEQLRLRLSRFSLVQSTTKEMRKCGGNLVKGYLCPPPYIDMWASSRRQIPNNIHENVLF